MRIIKFRVWSKAKQRWVENMALLACIDGLPFAHLVEQNTLDNSIKHHVYNMGGLEPVVQQFTGLLDRNKKEIYEGDILKIHGWRGSVGIVEVKWEEMDSSDDAGVNCVGFRRFDEYGEPTILGNIFENPELLEK